ncbi:cadherin-87A [Caerostris extrusa]|uniref:Cadherin-87A n=1 Tax=Caerostris extrusa TaxID=172846 RepID=A0AAV4QIX7_CAEEX|nr:cadherin-87A [Caerostris extrusa]
MLEVFFKYGAISILSIRNACDKFSVVTLSSSPQSSTASLVLRRTLDYAESNFYQIRLIADDGYFNTTEVISIRVGDVQNRPPVFVGSLTGLVDEDAPVGTLVMTLKAKDGDEGDSRSVTYELVTNPEDFFSIHPLTGELRTARLLDKEIFPSSNGVINVGVKATEVMSNGALAVGKRSMDSRCSHNHNPRCCSKEAFTSPQLSGTGTVTVNILDTNDNVPKFEKPEYKASIIENAPAGTVVDTITATDRDTMIFGEAGIVYSIFGNGAEKKFQVGETSGVITVAPCQTPGSGNCLDFETRPTYYLSYQAVDDMGRGLATVVPLTITLSDANDNAPVFLHESYSATIDEGAFKFDTPLRVQAVDADATSVRNGLDVSALRTDTIILTVQANDGGNGVVTTTVKITVKDANNNKPIFEKEMYEASIPESSPAGTVVEQVSASDADTGVNADISYRIQKGGSDDFDIHPRSGEITVKAGAKMDYDRRKEYNIEAFFDVIPESGEVKVASRLIEMAAIVTLTVIVTDISVSSPQQGTVTGGISLNGN